MSEQQVILCPNCNQKLSVPSNLGKLQVKCPICEETFSWNFIDIKKELKTSPLRKSPDSIPSIHSSFKSKLASFKSKSIAKGIAIIVGIILVSLVFYFNNVRVVDKSTSTKKSPKWVTISYSDLVDKSVIVRTGQTLGSALQDSRLRGVVQPYIDKYSYLLPYSVEMISGPDLFPLHNVVDHYPVGSKQPAWVAIFRGGRIFITTDNKNHTRIFLLGDDPQKAYEKNYPVIRHCLSGLLPNDGSNLTVEVFAYNNNYQKSELKLNLESYVSETSNFPPPAGTIPLDLVGLEEFFNKGGQLEGAKLDQNDGLILYGKKGSRQTVAGHNVSLTDFAAAYRAVFHAGDNEAFISLDSHKDPTKVTVNFGGFLEDTRIGSVVLEADKRFKTITSGLDPNSFKDLRSYTRQFVPTFSTSSERELLDKHFTAEGKWIGTRFWFYPESIEIESDFDYKYAKIINPRFTADAERFRDDFADLAEFERKKETTLSPSIRRNIEHLNQNYSQYARAYPELHELTSVARLMGICSWLQKANAHLLDQDALLSVELPPFRTDREKTQLLAVSYISYVESYGLDENYVKNNSKVVFLSPILDQTVKSYFSNSGNIAKYLCHKNNTSLDFPNRYEAEANRLISIYRNKKVREIIKTKEDLKALANYAISQLIFSSPAGVKKYETKMKRDESQLDKITAEINRVKIKMKSATGWRYNSYVDEYNRLVGQYETIRVRLNRNINIYNQFNVQSLTVTEIGGGINLEPQHFNIKRTVKSYKLKTFKNITKKAGLNWNSINGSGQWVRSRTKSGGSTHKNILPKTNWTSKSVSKSNGSTFTYLAAGPQQNYWSSTTKETNSWRDLFELEKSSYRERMYDGSQNTLHIAEYQSGKLENYITGKMVGKNRIIFSKPARQDLIKPQEPPIWWKNE